MKDKESFNLSIFRLINSETKSIVQTFGSYAAGAKALLKTNNAHFLQSPRRAFYFDDVKAQRDARNPRAAMAEALKKIEELERWEAETRKRVKLLDESFLEGNDLGENSLEYSLWGVQ